MAVPCNKIGPEILKALNLPSERCKEVRIICSANDVVRVEADYYPSGDQLDRVINVIGNAGRGRADGNP